VSRGCYSAQPDWGRWGGELLPGPARKPIRGGARSQHPCCSWSW